MIAGRVAVHSEEADGPSPPPVSVVIPALDAQDTLAATLESVHAQDYDGPMEIVVVDGSRDVSPTVALLRPFPDVRLVRNPERNTPSALNRGIAAATHAIIARCDAHAVLPRDYLSRAVSTLRRTGAANVGGRQHPVGATALGKAVALAMSTPLGAGDARYRVGGPAGPVDTVYLGVFQRDVLEAVGGFDSTLLRNQDYELNWRLRQAGQTVWFDPDLVADYRTRGTITALARQYAAYGAWKRAMLKKHPRSCRWRHLAAPAFILGLVCAGAAGAVGGALLDVGRAIETAVLLLVLAAAYPLFYVLVLFAGALVVGVRRRRWEAVLMPPALVTMHTAWGIGFLVGRARNAR